MSDNELKLFRGLVCVQLNEPLNIDDAGESKIATGYYQNFDALAASEEHARRLIESRVSDATIDWSRSEIQQEPADTDQFSKPEAFTVGGAAYF